MDREIKCENREIKCVWTPTMVEDIKNFKPFDYKAFDDIITEMIESEKQLKKRKFRIEKLKRILDE